MITRRTTMPAVPTAQISLTTVRLSQERFELEEEMEAWERKHPGLDFEAALEEYEIQKREKIARKNEY